MDGILSRKEIKILKTNSIASIMVITLIKGILKSEKISEKIQQKIFIITNE